MIGDQSHRFVSSIVFRKAERELAINQPAVILKTVGVIEIIDHVDLNIHFVIGHLVFFITVTPQGKSTAIKKFFVELEFDQNCQKFLHTLDIHIFRHACPNVQHLICSSFLIIRKNVEKIKICCLNL